MPAPLRPVAAAILAWLAQAAPVLADTLTYENARFGTRIAFPAELFETRMEPPANGDGMTWTNAGGASLAVYASHNTLEVDEAGLLADLKRSQPGISYSAKGDGWVVVSGIEDGVVFYQRLVFGADDVVHAVLLRYPETLKQTYDRLVRPISGSLSAP